MHDTPQTHTACWSHRVAVCNSLGGLLLVERQLGLQLLQLCGLRAVGLVCQPLGISRAPQVLLEATSSRLLSPPAAPLTAQQAPLSGATSSGNTAHLVHNHMCTCLQPCQLHPSNLLKCEILPSGVHTCVRAVDSSLSAFRILSLSTEEPLKLKLPCMHRFSTSWARSSRSLVRALSCALSRAISGPNTSPSPDGRWPGAALLPRPLGFI